MKATRLVCRAGAFAAAFVLLAELHVASAQPPVPPIQDETVTPLWTFRTRHIELQTDLPPGRAVDLLSYLQRLMLNLAIYWQQPPKGRIRYFVIENIDRWPKLDLDPAGRTKIAEKSGTTITLKSTLDGNVQSIESIVYATPDGRTPQHETVHAFCWQTFGRVGPDWFAEGMAEVAAYWRRDGTPEPPAWMTQYLRSPSSITPADIIADKLEGLQPWQIYAHRWALCHVLTTNPRYSTRFRSFGQALLRGEDVDFHKQFPEFNQQLAADYRTFLAALTPLAKNRPQ